MKSSPVILDALVLNEKPTGVGRSVIELIRAMSAKDRGLDFIVLTTEPNMFDFLIDVERWKVFDCPGARGGVIRKALFTQFIVPRLCKRFGAALLHSMQFIAPLVLDCPSVVTVHDLTWLDFAETIEQPRLSYYRLIVPRALDQADRILANSKATGTGLVSAFPRNADKMVVTRFGTPSWVWQARKRALESNGSFDTGTGPSTERPYFLFVSTLEPRKNLLGILQAYEIFHHQARKDGKDEEQIPDLRLVGPRGWKDSPLQKALSRLQSTGRVHLLDHRFGDDLWNCYRLAQGLLFPSFHEGFGFPILEGMAAELPVMTSNRGAMAEVGGDCVLFADPDDPGDMASKMASLAWDLTLSQDLRQRGLVRARDWTWEITADLTCQSYFSVLNLK